MSDSSFNQSRTPVQVDGVAYAPAETPAERRRQARYSEWDPRSAPGTYFLLAVNVFVFLWMILHGVSPQRPHTCAAASFRRQ